MNRKVAFLVYSALGLGAVFVLGCSQSNSSSVEMMVIQPVGGNCEYKVDYAPVTTLSDVNKMVGSFGRVVYHRKDLFSRTSILEDAEGFQTIDAHFSVSGNSYGPLDMATLFSASLYYGIEKTALMFKGLDASADMAQVIPNLADTLIVYNAKEAGGDGIEVQDNATFVAVKKADGTYQRYFLAYPTESVSKIPLGLNLGVVAHEFTHLVFEQLFSSGRQETNDTIETANTLDALNEGMADYFGYMASRDANFVACSLESQSFRNLAVAKSVDAAHASLIRSDSQYDYYQAGAVWASTQY